MPSAWSSGFCFVFKHLRSSEIHPQGALCTNILKVQNQHIEAQCGRSRGTRSLGWSWESKSVFSFIIASYLPSCLLTGKERLSTRVVPAIAFAALMPLTAFRGADLRNRPRAVQQQIPWGRRPMTAISSARTASSIPKLWPIDQPTTLREYRSRTTHRYIHPSAGGT